MKKPSAKPSAPPETAFIPMNLRAEPPSLAQNMNVERVWSAISAAETGFTRDLFCLYRDVLSYNSHLQTEFAKRKIAVLGDKRTIMAVDEKDPSSQESAGAVQQMLDGCPTLKAGLVHLLDAALWPVSVLEKIFAPATVGGRRYILARLVPVPHWLLDYTSGAMRIHDVDAATGTIQSTTHEVDPERYIVHRGHLLTSPDTWGGPMRSLLFWWLLATMTREWWARFLDRYGSPFLVGKYPKNDDKSRRVLQQAFSLSVRLGGLVVSDETKVEIMQAAQSQSGDAYEKFLTVCNREISKLILGQTLSAEAQATGMNSGVSTMQEGVRQDIRGWDCESLADTLRLQLFEQYLRINDLAVPPPTLTWGSKSPAELKALGDLLASFKNAGVRLTDAGIQSLSKDVGLPLERDPGSPAGAFTMPGVGAL